MFNHWNRLKYGGTGLTDKGFNTGRRVGVLLWGGISLINANSMEKIQRAFCYRESKLVLDLVPFKEYHDGRHIESFSVSDTELNALLSSQLCKDFDAPRCQLHFQKQQG